MTLPTNEQLEAMLANATKGDWFIDPKYMGEVQTTGNLSIASCWSGVYEGVNLRLTGVNDCSLPEAASNAALIALAPTLAAQRIADAKRIAELEAEISELRKYVTVLPADEFNAACDALEATP